jgi:hypothetical protein
MPGSQTEAARLRLLTQSQPTQEAEVLLLTLVLEESRPRASTDKSCTPRLPTIWRVGLHCGRTAPPEAVVDIQPAHSGIGAM